MSFEITDQCTFKQALDLSSRYLDENTVFFGHGTDNSWDEAVALLLWAADLPIDSGQSILGENLPEEALARFVNAMNVRVNDRKPVPYITNEAWFYGLPFYVDESVLIPRSPIAELIANQYSPWLKKKPEKLLDLCCGSGCIGIAAALALPDSEVVLSDISNKAIDIAEKNIDAHRCSDRVTAVCGDLFKAVQHKTFDLILCNPPYVDLDDLSSMPTEYLHEPEIALGSGADGLDLARQILDQAVDYLNDEGVLVLEVGNSWVQMQDAYPNFPFIWLEFEQGGHGVCVLSKADLENDCFRQ